MNNTFFYYSILILVTLFAGWLMLPAVAASEEVPAVWRVEITAYHEPTHAVEDGLLSRLRGWLASQVARQRPPIGTKFTVHSSAYASSPYQTDATPCITAAGTRVRQGVVATNFLPMGTLLKINGQLHIVEDRMNPRYQGRYIDLWFPSTSAALAHGRQTLEAEIMGYGTPGQELVLVDTDDEKSSGIEAEEIVKQPTVLQRVNLRFIAITRSFAGLLGANVNRYDVDCFKDERE